MIAVKQLNLPLFSFVPFHSQKIWEPPAGSPPPAPRAPPAPAVSPPPPPPISLINNNPPRDELPTTPPDSPLPPPPLHQAPIFQDIIPNSPVVAAPSLGGCRWLLYTHSNLVNACSPCYMLSICTP